MKSNFEWILKLLIAGLIARTEALHTQRNSKEGIKK